MIDKQNNSRLRSLLKRGRYAYSCRLCNHLDYGGEDGDMDRTECLCCEEILWDSRHMVENDTVKERA